MAQVPNTRRIAIENFPKQKDWIGKLLDPLNNLITSVVSAFDAALTQQQNMVAQINSFSVRTDSLAFLTEPLSYRITMRSKPQGVVVFQIQEQNTQEQPYLDAVMPLWYVQDQNVFVYHITGLQSDKEYQVTLWACGG